MKLEDLKPAPGATKTKRRVGRGPGSGAGKTASKGHKGQKARSGGVKGAGFEGGQMPLQRRMPKRGFRNNNKSIYMLLNVAELEKIAQNGLVTPQIAGLTDIEMAKGYGLKILGHGSISANITVKAHKFSKSASEKICAVGGVVEVL